MKTFFTSDTHFDHTNILKYANRPFRNVDEMNEALIANWNEVVSPKDEVYHLGDFCFSKNPDKFLHRLNGIKYLIKGNHDSKTTIDSIYWHDVCEYREIKVEDTKIVLLHYAMKVWNRSHKGAYHLYGHSHGSLKDDPNSLSIDVGVDCHDYKPISFEQVKSIMDTKTFVPIDHHRERRK